MAAPKGNTYGYGNPRSGRPREWKDSDIEEEAQIFIEWAQRKDALVWREFASLRGYPHTYLYDWIEKNEAFRYAAEYARTAIGTRRERLHLDKMVSRYAPLYDEKLAEYEDNQEKLKAELKKNNEKALSDAETIRSLIAICAGSSKEISGIIQPSQPTVAPEQSLLH